MGEDGELEALEIADSVHDLVDGTIAADDDEERRAAENGFPRERSELAGFLREQCGSSEAE
jgi:hypothetical protein